ncbi:MAG: hypothetical protein KDB03_16450, partial [Planctomycetales bacterium]|nr:hypothetical protein [Planctomycetales bacterium]
MYVRTRKIFFLRTVLLVCVLVSQSFIGNVWGQPTTGLAKKPLVLIDSYHVHNFLQQGLKPGIYNYHQYSAFRRAVDLLRNRGLEIQELLVGPYSAEDFAEASLLIVNLPSMDRPPWLVDEIHVLEEFVNRGGGILFITDHSNCYYHQYQLWPLFDRFGIIPTFETVCERDPQHLFATGNGWILIDRFAPHPITQSLRSIGIQTGGRVLSEQASDLLAATTENAWADMGSVPLYGEGDIGLYGDFLPSAAEDSGVQHVLLAKSIGKGRVAVFSDQNAFGDAGIAFGDNWKLWLQLCTWTGRLHEPSESPSATETNRIEKWNAVCYDPIVISDLAESKTGTAAKLANLTNRFTWSGTDDWQLQNLWVWINRFCWCSSNDTYQR